MMPIARSTQLLVRTLLAALLWFTPGVAVADPPCDTYPPAKQIACAAIWRQLNEEGAKEIAQFGLAQQKRRDNGQMTAEQHLAENMAFIKQATEKRLQRLKERMAKE
jgi:hypothetical protein